MSFPSDLVYFRASEFNHPDLMSVPFLRWLDRVRGRAGVPFYITSDVRPDDPPLHGTGDAVDIRTSNLDANQKFRVASAVFAFADEAPGKVEFVVGYRQQPHFHVAVDPRPGHDHEFVESED